MKKKNGSIRINLLYNIMYQMLVVLIPLLTTPYVSRVLGPTAIGAYSYTLSIATYFGILGALGASTYGQLQVARSRDSAEALAGKFYTVFLSKMITFLIAFMGYIFVIKFSKEYRELYLVLVIYLAAQMMDISWFFQGLEIFSITVSRNVVTKAASVCLIFLTVRKPEDLIRYVMIQQGAVLISNISMWFSLHDYIGLPKLCIRDAFINIKQNLIYFVPTIATVVYVSMDKCMIGWITQSNLENGYYEQATKIYSMLIALITALTTVLLPRMTFLWEEESSNRKEITTILKKALSYIAEIVFPIAFGLYVTSDTLVPVFFGEGYEKCGVLLKIFSVMIIFTSFNSIISNSCMVACGKQRKLNKLLILSSLVNVTANLVLIHFIGAIGAALASLFSEGALFICIVLKNRRFLSAVQWIKKGLKYFSFSVFMAVTVVLSKSFVSFDNTILLLFEIFVGGLVYCICLLVSRDELVYEVADKIVDLVRRR